MYRYIRSDQTPNGNFLNKKHIGIAVVNERAAECRDSSHGVDFSYSDACHNLYITLTAASKRTWLFFSFVRERLPLSDNYSRRRRMSAAEHYFLISNDIRVMRT